MGFFAILRKDGDRSDLEVVECHLNLWVLPGLLGERPFYCDVGLHIRTGDTPLRELRIALPAGANKCGFEDLGNRLTSQQVAQLIFGKPVTYPSPDSIDYGQGQLKILLVPSANLELDKERSTSDFTLWTIRTASPLPSHSEGYLRVRFLLSQASRIWYWKKFLLTRYGALVDIRFCDVREAWNVKDGNALRTSIIPIRSLNFFVVVSSFFHLVATSPPLHYTRILEGKPWTSYLRRRVSVLGNKKLSIYQWRNQSPLDPDNPMRVYLDLGSDLRDLSTLNWVLGCVLLFLLISYASLMSGNVWSAIDSIFTTSGRWAQLHYWKVILTVGGIIVARLVFNIETIKTRIRQLKIAYYWCEKVFFFTRLS